ncbi:MAG: hypothetical protein ACE5JX_21465 [Acidobacteriota bacterium]
MKGWEIVSDIKRLLSKGLGVSAVARQLKVERKTVCKYRDLDMDEVGAARRKASRRTRKLNRFRALPATVRRIQPGAGSAADPDLRNRGAGRGVAAILPSPLS